MPSVAAPGTPWVANGGGCDRSPASTWLPMLIRFVLAARRSPPSFYSRAAFAGPANASRRNCTLLRGSPNLRRCDLHALLLVGAFLR